MCDSKQKSSYKHVSDFQRLRIYGHFLIPVHALMWTTFTEPAGGIMNSASLVASGSVCSSGRAVHNRAAACVAAGGGIFENQL